MFALQLDGQASAGQAGRVSIPGACPAATQASPECCAERASQAGGDALERKDTVTQGLFQTNPVKGRQPDSEAILRCANAALWCGAGHGICLGPLSTSSILARVAAKLRQRGPRVNPRPRPPLLRPRPRALEDATRAAARATASSSARAPSAVETGSSAPACEAASLQSGAEPANEAGSASSGTAAGGG